MARHRFLPRNETIKRADRVALNRFSRVVQEWFVDQVRGIESRIIAEQAALKTKADTEAYVHKVQEKIRRCFGPEPERTPLNPRVRQATSAEPCCMSLINRPTRN